MKNYRVLITTSSTGSRLKDLTKNTNKSLVKVGEKMVIDYIIQSYPQDIELVVTLGYYGNKVKKYLEKKYPQRRFIFINIDRYQGEGSSLGYSMLAAREYLQCPFIFHCNDTLVFDPVPEPRVNWNGGSLGNDPKLYNTQSYSSFSVKGEKMISLNPKGAESFDYFHIGLVGIKDFTPFWEALDEAYRASPNDSTLNDVVAMKKMISDGIEFVAREFKGWHDTGNLPVLDHTIKILH